MSAFLEIPESGWVGSNGLAFAIRDRFPVSRGHTLIITRRVVRDWFCATSAERAALLELVDVVKKQLDDELHPDGFNVGFNAGAAAGQTVEHLHVHVIPRFHGDMDDPRGGVRLVIPSRGNYLTNVDPLAAGRTTRLHATCCRCSNELRTSRLSLRSFRSPDWTGSAPQRWPRSIAAHVFVSLPATTWTSQSKRT